MMISKFWKALDELSDGGSSRHGWDQRLGDEWKAMAPFFAYNWQIGRIPCLSQSRCCRLSTAGGSTQLWHGERRLRR